MASMVSSAFETLQNIEMKQPIHKGSSLRSRMWIQSKLSYHFSFKNVDWLVLSALFKKAAPSWSITLTRLRLYFIQKWMIDILFQKLLRIHFLWKKSAPAFFFPLFSFSLAFSSHKHPRFSPLTRRQMLYLFHTFISSSTPSNFH